MESDNSDLSDEEDLDGISLGGLRRQLYENELLDKGIFMPPLKRMKYPNQPSPRSYYVQLAVTAVVLIFIGINFAIAYKRYQNRRHREANLNNPVEPYDAPLMFNSDNISTIGAIKDRKVFLAIGIPTVFREDASYLQQTIDSLIQSTTVDQREDIILVVFIADLDEAKKANTKRTLQMSYIDHLESGFLRIIEAPSSYYPPLHDLEGTHGDDQERVSWRAKQVADYAFLFVYCDDLADYYLQLEDDALAVGDFVTAIKEFIAMQHSPWVSLEFSRLGYIGKLYHSYHLDKLAKFVLLFYAEQPIDYLYQYFNVLMAQPKAISRTPSLFQHVGVHSSLKAKKQNLQDAHFDSIPKEHQGDNPPVQIQTDIQTFQAFHPHLAYSSLPGYFWGRSPKAGNTMTLIFDKPWHIARFVVETGSEGREHDFLQNGKVEGSETFVQGVESKSSYCIDYVYIGIFSGGRFDRNDLEKHVPFKVRCLRITVLKDQQAWLLIRQIAVFTHQS